MDSPLTSHQSELTTKLAVVAITAALYTLGKGLTGYIPSPWGVGQLLVGIFLPAFFAVVADTLAVATGAGMGTFIGDVLFLAPLNHTTPVLSLIAGVPANFIGFLLFGWFVKRYSSWSAFVAATVTFVTLGNLIAATSVVLFLSLPIELILGLTVFWNTTSIPAIIIAVPILIRIARPTLGRSRILNYLPQWSGSTEGRQTSIALVFAMIFVGIGAVIFLGAPETLAGWPGLAGYFALAAALVVIFGPLASFVAGSRVGANQVAN